MVGKKRREGGRRERGRKEGEGGRRREDEEEGGRMRGRGEGGGDRICNQRDMSATNDNVALIGYSVC